jgi:hypothetical protein
VDLGALPSQKRSKLAVRLPKARAGDVRGVLEMPRGHCLPLASAARAEDVTGHLVAASVSRSCPAPGCSGASFVTYGPVQGGLACFEGPLHKRRYNELAITTALRLPAFRQRWQHRDEGGQGRDSRSAQGTGCERADAVAGQGGPGPPGSGPASLV